jgi:enamine deaminase RidA (YjgF/YER057c/UK114 family)
MTDPPPVELVRPDRLAPGVGYAYAAVPRGRSLLVFTAGACPLDEGGATVAPGALVEQAEQAMHNLRAALESAGARLSDVVKTTVYVASADRADLVTVWDAVRRHFGDHDPPSTLLGVSALGYPDQLVEVEAVAAVPG